MFADILSLIARLRAPPAPGMRDRRHQMRQAATAQVRLNTAKSARFGGSVPSTHRFAASMRAAGAIYPCPSRSETRSLAAKTPEFGECRIKSYCKYVANRLAKVPAILKGFIYSLCQKNRLDNSRDKLITMSGAGPWCYGEKSCRLG
jgi:hypothetical protein